MVVAQSMAMVAAFQFITRSLCEPVLWSVHRLFACAVCCGLSCTYSRCRHLLTPLPGRLLYARVLRFGPLKPFFLSHILNSYRAHPT